MDEVVYKRDGQSRYHGFAGTTDGLRAAAPQLFTDVSEDSITGATSEAGARGGEWKGGHIY